MEKKVQSKFQRNFSSSFAQSEFGFSRAFYVKQSKDFINNGIMVEKQPFIIKASNNIAVCPSHCLTVENSAMAGFSSGKEKLE